MEFRWIVIGVAFLLAIGRTQAGPPFVTEDPEPPPVGGWEINIPFTLERTPGKTEMDVPLFDLNYGLPNLQLKVEFPVKLVHQEREGTTAGAGDLGLGVKWRLLNDEQSKFQFGIYPQLTAATGNQARDLGAGGPAFWLPVTAQKSWDKWTLYGNAGYWWQTAAETRNYVFAGTVLEREISARLTLAAELFGNSRTERGGRPDFAFHLGGIWEINPHVNLLFAGGRDIVGDTRAMAYVGLQFLTK